MRGLIVSGVCGSTERERWRGRGELTPQLESQEHSIGRKQDKAETSTHGKQVIELSTSRDTLSSSLVDDGRGHWVGIMEGSR
jgi:hypothetical protein